MTHPCHHHSKNTSPPAEYRLLGAAIDSLQGARRPPLDFPRLRELVPMSRVLELLAWIPSRERGPQLRGPCPVHHSENSRSRSFSVNLECNAFQCFKCGEAGNQLDLWAAVTKLSLYDAGLDLCQTAGIDPPFRS